MSLTRGLVLDVANQLGGAMPGVVTLHDWSREKNDGAMANVTWVQLASTGLWVMVFNGTTAEVPHAASTVLCQSFIAWIYPDDKTTRSIADFDGGTHSVEMDAAGNLTATGWAAPSLYVTGSVASAAITESAWNFIAVTTATAFTASAVTLGHEATWFDGNMALVSLFNYVLSPAQIRARFHSTKWLFGVAS